MKKRNDVRGRFTVACYVTGFTMLLVGIGLPIWFTRADVPPNVQDFWDPAWKVAQIMGYVLIGMGMGSHRR